MMEHDVGGSWHPSPIDAWRTYLSPSLLEGFSTGRQASLTSNFGYNLQYLEYLDFRLAEATLHSTIRALQIKTFVVVSVGIVEGVFYYTLYQHKIMDTPKWKEIQAKENLPADAFAVRRRSRVKGSQSRPKGFQAMIRIVQDNDLLELPDETYESLHSLRDLRNQIHIHNVEFASDTDRHVFRDEHWQRSKEVLYDVFPAIIQTAEARVSREKIVRDGLLWRLLRLADVTPLSREVRS